MRTKREEVNLVNASGTRTTVIKVTEFTRDVAEEGLVTVEWIEVSTTFKGDDGYWTRNKDGTFTDPQGIGGWRATF